MQFSDCLITRADPQTQRFVTITSQKGVVVGMQPIDSFRFDFDFIVAVHRYAFGEFMNRPVRAFVFVRTDNVVQRHVAIFVCLAMNLVYFWLLLKPIIEFPRLNFGFGGC